MAYTNFFCAKSETFFVSRTQNLCPRQMLRARSNRETFLSATMCPRRCVLVCHGLNVATSFVVIEVILISCQQLERETWLCSPINLGFRLRLNCARNTMVVYSILTNLPIETNWLYNSFIVYERKKNRVVHGRGPSNITLGIFVCSCDICRVFFFFISL